VPSRGKRTFLAHEAFLGLARTIPLRAVAARSEWLAFAISRALATGTEGPFVAAFADRTVTTGAERLALAISGTIETARAFSTFAGRALAARSEWLLVSASASGTVAARPERLFVAARRATGLARTTPSWATPAAPATA
jgi:hypothetical protein